MKYENGLFISATEYCNSKLKEFKVNYLDETSDFVSPNDFHVLKLFWNNYK